MATTGAVLYLRPTLVSGTMASRQTAASLFVALRFVSGIFSQVGISSSRDLANLRTFLPHSRQPVLNADGTMNSAWYRFFQVFVDVFLGGAGSYTLQDIVDTVLTAQADVTQQAAVTSAVAMQSQTNAEALSVVKQVVVNNGLSGSSQIPDVQTNLE